MPIIHNANIDAIRFAQQAGDYAAPAAGYWRIYVKSDGLYIIDENSNVTGPFVDASAITGYVQLAPDADADNVVQPSNNSIPLTLKANAAQTKNLLVVSDSSGGTLAAFNQRGKLQTVNAATTPPIFLPTKAASPTNQIAGDLYLDDGTNTTDGNIRWRRYTGATWVDVGGTDRRALLGSSIIGGGGAASISVASIPATYNDLEVIAILRTDANPERHALFQVGNSGLDTTAGNYDTSVRYGDGTSNTNNEFIGSDSGWRLNQAQSDSGSTASCFGVIKAKIFNYANGNMYKHAVFEWFAPDTLASGAIWQGTGGGVWESTSAITDVGFVPQGGNNYVQYSELRVYGIL